MATEAPLAGVSKVCSGPCGQSRDLSEFEVTRTHPQTGTQTRHSKCVECRNEQRRAASAARYARNREYQIDQVQGREATGGKAKKPSHVPRGPETAQELNLTAKEWVALNRWGAGPSDSLRRLLQAVEAAGLRPPAS